MAIAKEIFDTYDEEKKGFLNVAQLGKFMVEVSEKFGTLPPTADEVKLAMNDLDENKDGELDFEELKPTIM